MLGFEKSHNEELSLMPREEIESKYYIRLEIEDKAGVLAKISSLFEENNISIEKFKI